MHLPPRMNIYIESNCKYQKCVTKVIMWLSFLNCHHDSRYKYIPMFEYFFHILEIYSKVYSRYKYIPMFEYLSHIVKIYCKVYSGRIY